MGWLKSWSCWVLLVSGCAIFLLPKFPFYQDWMPYGYDLGGLALVVLYLSLGFWSFGLYSLVTGGMSWKSVSQKRRYAFKMGMAALGFASGLVWLYLKLMNLTLNL